MQGWSNIWKPINYINVQKSHDYLNRCRESLCQNPIYFHDGSPREYRIRGTYPSTHTKSYAQETHNHIILNGEKLEAIHLKSGMNETGLSTVSTPFQYCLLSTDWSNKTREGN